MKNDVTIFLLHCLRAVLFAAQHLHNGWKRAWDFIFTRSVRLIQWAFSDYVLILLFTVLAINLVQHRVEITNSYRPVTCSTSDIVVRIYAPDYYAAKDTLDFRIMVRNTSGDTIENLRIGIIPTDDFWFPEEKNTLTITNLAAYDIFTGQISAQSLEFTPTQKEIEVQAFIQLPGSPPEFCEKDFILRNGKWRNLWVSFQSLPGFVDFVVKGLGYLVAFASALLAVSGKWRDVWEKLDKWAGRHDD